MGFTQSKIGRMAIAAAVVVLTLAMRHDANGPATRSSATMNAPVRTAGFGGVLISKRMKMILGFVQTLPV